MVREGVMTGILSTTVESCDGLSGSGMGLHSPRPAIIILIHYNLPQKHHWLGTKSTKPVGDFPRLTVAMMSLKTAYNKEIYSQDSFQNWHQWIFYFLSLCRDCWRRNVSNIFIKTASPQWLREKLRGLKKKMCWLSEKFHGWGVPKPEDWNLLVDTRESPCKTVF